MFVSAFTFGPQWYLESTRYPTILSFRHPSYCADTRQRGIPYVGHYLKESLSFPRLPWQLSLPYQAVHLSRARHSGVCFSSLTDRQESCLHSQALLHYEPLVTARIGKAGTRAYEEPPVKTLISTSSMRHMYHMNRDLEQHQQHDEVRLQDGRVY